MDEQTISKLASETNAEARPYQLRVVAKAVTALAPQSDGGRGLDSVLIESPTGSGKTAMALFTLKQLQRQYGIRIGWVAMRRNLLQQVQVENKKLGMGVDLVPISMFDKDPPTDLDMLVIDECQHDAATSCVNLHNRIRPRWTIGLTATPFRTDRLKLCFSTVIKDAGLATLIKDGYLSQYDYFTIPAWSPELVSTFYLKDPERWGKSLMFFHTVEQAYECCKLLQKAGIDTDVVTGSTDRERQLEAFEEGRTTVLVNCMVLTEGFDSPNLQTVWCRRSCKALTIQMAGRVFRKHESVPVKQVVQPENTKWPIIKTAMPATQYKWQCEAEDKLDQGEWLSLTVNPKINEINCRVIISLAQINVKLPAFLTTKKGKRRRQQADGQGNVGDTVL